MKVYLDNCCYNRPYDDQSQFKVFLETQSKLHIQKLITEGKLELVYSYMSRYENAQNPFEIRRNTISQFFKNASVYVDETNAVIIINKAREIMQTGVKTKDAIHVSCAIFAKAEYFLTTDVRLLKYKSNEIKIMNPIDFINELEG
ncbi:MAG: hypothetical protein J6I46_00645 [Ruminococcus sp.]|nr:hypothetical protein [Ruminococcus sp.]